MIAVSATRAYKQPKLTMFMSLKKMKQTIQARPIIVLLFVLSTEPSLFHLMRRFDMLRFGVIWINIAFM